jgi:hypothetical protein
MSTASTSSPSTSLPDLLGTFSHLPHADIINCSSDAHDFRVQKFYVVDGSPVLREKVTSCEATTVDGKFENLSRTLSHECRCVLFPLLSLSFSISDADRGSWHRMSTTLIPRASAFKTIMLSCTTAIITEPATVGRSMAPTAPALSGRSCARRSPWAWLSGAPYTSLESASR